MANKKSLRDQLASGSTVWVAGVYDALSARIAQDAGFDAVMTGGYGITATQLGMPDFELLTLTENTEVVSRVSRILSIPVIADIDTGYGNAINVLRTVREFRAAGAQAVIMEDQVSPKRCPVGVSETELIPVEEATAKIRAAKDAAGDDLIVIARTDAFDPAEAMERAKAYRKAGADLIQPVSKTFSSIDDLVRLRKECGPLSLQLLSWLEGLTKAEVESVAAIAYYPLVALTTSTAALKANFTSLMATKDCAQLPRERTSMADFDEFIGFSSTLESQKRYYFPKS